MKIFSVILSVILLLSLNSQAQICDSLTPVFNVDLTGQPNGTWISPPVIRDGKCCGVTGSDRCLQFNLTLDPAVNAIAFDIYSGAVPGGSMFFQINCGPPQPVGQAICINGPGPHIITFCKPGNNTNQYYIRSISYPSIGGTQYVSQSCIGTLIANGLEENTIQWTSIPSNPLYNSFLNCANGCDTAIVTPNSGFAGTIDYQVCGSVVGGCNPYTFCDTFSVVFVNDLSVAITPQNPTICFGGPNVTVTANITGGLAPYNYLWSNGATTNSITVGPGTYYVNIVDQMNCSVASDTVVVNGLPSLISCEAGASGTLCLNNLAFQLNGQVIVATGGQWTGSGNFIPSNTVLNPEYYPSPSDIANGFVDIQFVTTGNFNCPGDTDYIHVDISSNPLPQLNGPQQGCINETSNYSAVFASGDTYQWAVTGGNIISQSQNNITVQWTSTGINQVSLTQTNSFGCDSVTSLIVVVSPAPAPVVVGPTVVCSGGTVSYSLYQPTPGNTYQWSVSNGTLSSPTANPVIVTWGNPGPGSLTITETNAYGCDSTITIQINVTPQPTPVIAGLGTVCNYQHTIYQSPAVPGNQYDWIVSSGYIISQSQDSIRIQWNTLGSGSVTLTETTLSGCDSTTIFNVQIIDAPTPTVSGPQYVCSRAMFTYNVSGINSNTTINWYITGGSIESGAATNTVNVIWYNPGVGELQVRVVNPNGCDSVVTYPVVIIEGVQPEMEGPNQACLYDTSVYSVSDVQGHSYSWQVTGGQFTHLTPSRIQVLWQTTGTNEVTVTETSPVGCDSTISMFVIVNPLPIIPASGSPSVCEDEAEIYLTTAQPGYTYWWTVGGGNITGPPNQSSVNCTWNQPGQYMINLLGTNQFGCSDTTSIPVTVTAKPVVSILGNTAGCMNNNSVFNITQSPGVSYTYNATGGIVTSQSNGSVSVTWLSTGSHTFSANATNINTGCTNQNSLAINVEPLPYPVVNASQYAGCSPLTISFANNNSNPDYNYTWSFGEGNLSFLANPQHTYGQSGSFPVMVRVSNNAGCVDSAAGLITVYPSPVSAFNFDNPVTQFYVDFEEVKMDNMSAGAISWQWDLGNGTVTSAFEPTVIYDEPGFYDITLDVVNSYGCRHTSVRRIEAIVPENIYIPNAITPNGDTNNDFFSVSFYNITQAHISIFNRWGELIYETEDMDFKWDGSMNGRNVQNDVYVYKINAIGYYGTEITKIGRISVLY